jgi:hypothetical protein
MSEGSESAPPLMALLPGAPIEYEANLVSYFDPVFTRMFGNKAFIAASGYIGTTSLKASLPCGLPL